MAIILITAHKGGIHIQTVYWSSNEEQRLSCKIKVNKQLKYQHSLRD